MKFFDEAKIEVIAGDGGNGVASFRRRSSSPSADRMAVTGGRGGSIWAIADRNLNTLIDFRYTRVFRAQKGENGRGSDCYGKGGDDMELRVPVGTVITDLMTGEAIADLDHDGKRALIAKVARAASGICISSRAPTARQTVHSGKPGDHRELKLELRVLADVGLLGLPNAGKSTFIRPCRPPNRRWRTIRSRRFIPTLGVVRVDHERSFVIADIPGLIEGAAEAPGLAIAFSSICKGPGCCFTSSISRPTIQAAIRRRMPRRF